MYQPKLEKDIRCPLEYGLDVFGGRWKSRILCVLATRGTLRYNQLRSEMVNISDAVLALNLKELIADGMLRREQFDEIPPRVEYSLTPTGHSLLPVIEVMAQWGEKYKKAAARKAGKKVA